MVKRGICPLLLLVLDGDTNIRYALYVLVYSMDKRRSAMVIKVYTPTEVAEILRITEEDVLMLINKGDLPAFPVLRQARVSEQTLEEFMRRPYSGPTNRPEKKVRGGRNRNLELERACRERMKNKIREVAPDWQPLGGRIFAANGNQLIVCVATKPTPKTHFFGFKERDLLNGRPTFLMLGLADREDGLVIPYDKFRAAIDGLSVSTNGYKKLHILIKAESYYLMGKGIDQAIPLDSYVNAFYLLN